jgi:dipeptidyl-peptidase-4
MSSSSAASASEQKGGEVAIDSEFLSQYAATYRFRNGRPKVLSAVAGGQKVLFLRSESSTSFEQGLYEYDLASDSERSVLAPGKKKNDEPESLSQEEKARRERIRMSAKGVVGYSLNGANDEVLIPINGGLVVVGRESGKVVAEVKSETPGFPMNAQFSPDGRWVSCVRNGNLCVAERGGRQRHEQLSPAKDRDTLAFGLPEFVAQEEMDRTEGYWWSPDSTHMLYQRTDTAGLEEMHIVDPAHPEKAPSVFRYPRPGRTNAQVSLLIGRVGCEG